LTFAFFLNEGIITVQNSAETLLNGGNYLSNTWYHIEFRNINWSAKTFDLYVDNVSVLTGVTFRNTDATSVGKIWLYNFDDSTAFWDEIEVLQ